jgi:hypothetical protein
MGGDVVGWVVIVGFGAETVALGEDAGPVKI